MICLSNCFNRPEEVYHVTVMPCYDKKLEASRDDFVFQLDPRAEGHEGEVNMISEVDSVLTTGEILELIQVRNFMHTIFFCEFFHFLTCILSHGWGSIFQSKEVDFKSLEEAPLDKL